MGKYIFMNQNTEILKFEFNNDLNIITNIYEIYNLNYAPLNINNIEKSKLLIEFNNWFNDRGIPVYRDNARELTEAFGINNVKELINKDYALSVSDQYWFKPESSDIEWSNINYFDRDYDSINFADATYGSGAGKLLNQSKKDESYKTPNNTSNGQLKKVWIKVNNENYLYKGAGTIHNFEPINEVLASKICDILEVPHVEYKLDIIHSARKDSLVSVCKCAINKNEEIIPAHSILTENIKEVKKDIDDYYVYLNILKSNNVQNAEEYLQKMLMLDYMLLNEDRHLNNFGVIRDVQTLKWKRICPIFDTGRSMNTNVTTSYWDFYNGEVKCFTKDFIPVSNLEKFFSIKISIKKIEELKALKQQYKEMLTEYKEYTKLSNDEIEKITDGYKVRIEQFDTVLREKDLLIF